jgi:hypothetical protein
MMKPPVLSKKHPCDFCRGTTGTIRWCAIVFEGRINVVQAMLHPTSSCIDGFIERCKRQYEESLNGQD